MNSFVGSQIYPGHSTIVCIALFIYLTQKLHFLTPPSSSDRLSRPFEFFHWLSNLSWSFYHCLHNPFHLSYTEIPFPNPSIHRRKPNSLVGSHLSLSFDHCCLVFSINLAILRSCCAELLLSPFVHVFFGSQIQLNHFHLHCTQKSFLHINRLSFYVGSKFHQCLEAIMNLFRFVFDQLYEVLVRFIIWVAIVFHWSVLHVIC